MEIFWLGSDEGNILGSWAFNSRAGDGISVVAVPLVTRGKVVRVKNPEDCRELSHQ
jgi:hypothetical protein